MTDIVITDIVITDIVIRQHITDITDTLASFCCYVQWYPTYINESNMNQWLSMAINEFVSITISIC